MTRAPRHSSRHANVAGGRANVPVLHSCSPLPLGEGPSVRTVSSEPACQYRSTASGWTLVRRARATHLGRVDGVLFGCVSRARGTNVRPLAGVGLRWPSDTAAHCFKLGCFFLAERGMLMADSSPSVKHCGAGHCQPFSLEERPVSPYDGRACVLSSGRGPLGEVNRCELRF